MFAKQTLQSRKAEHIAGQAWDNLVTAVDSAGTSARSATRRARRQATKTSDRVGSSARESAREARRRANAAMDALAGKRPARPWGWLAIAAMFGAALGWVATTLGRQVASRPNPLELPDSLADDAMLAEEPKGAGRGSSL